MLSLDFIVPISTPLGETGGDDGALRLLTWSRILPHHRACVDAASRGHGRDHDHAHEHLRRPHHLDDGGGDGFLVALYRLHIHARNRGRSLGGSLYRILFHHTHGRTLDHGALDHGRFGHGRCLHIRRYSPCFVVALFRVLVNCEAS
jgi:hypothetical protein